VGDDGKRDKGKGIAELVAESSWVRDLLERDRRLAEDPVYAAKVQAEEAQRGRDEAAAVLKRRREGLLERGVPAKDVDALLSSTLFASRSLASAREWLASDRTLLVISGTRGVGKTTAAAWLASEVSGSRFIDAAHLMRVDVYSNEEMNPLEQCPLLVMDELGGEYMDTKGKLLSLVDGLVNTRYAAKLRTVITTNMPANDFEEQKGVRKPGFKTRYGERLADRIREVGRFVEISGPSLRGGAR
jgi:DNA replication protein DnaC